MDQIYAKILEFHKDFDITSITDKVEDEGI